MYKISISKLMRVIVVGISITLALESNAAEQCLNMHAALIAEQEGVPDCGDTDIGTVDTAIAGLNLDRSICDGLTPNQCSQYFINNPEDMLRNSDPTFDMQAVFFETHTKCADGLPPLTYYAPGMDDPNTADDEANKWIFFLHGRNLSCRPTVNRSDTIEQLELAGQTVITPMEQTCWTEAMNKSLGGETGYRTSFSQPQRTTKGGIMNVDATFNPHFYNWNRVYVHACNNDNYLGDSVKAGVLNPGSPVEYIAPVYAQGAEMLEDLISHFDENATAGNPDLSDATQVMLAGSSGGSWTLRFRLDALAEMFTDSCNGIAPQAKIGGVLDSGSLVPAMLEEALHDDTNPLQDCSSSFEGTCSRNAYFDPELGHDPDLGLDFDHTAFLSYYLTPSDKHAYGIERVKYDAWNASDAMDQSCFDYHLPNSDEFHCYDKDHVLAHHIQTPIFIIDSLRDSGRIASPPVWLSEDQPDLCWLDLVDGDQKHKDRLFEHMDSLYSERTNHAHGDAHGAPSPGFFIVDFVAHEFMKYDDRFNDIELTVTHAGFQLSNSLSDSLYHWTQGRNIQLINGHPLVTQQNNGLIDSQINQLECKVSPNGY